MINDALAVAARSAIFCETLRQECVFYVFSKLSGSIKPEVGIAHSLKKGTFKKRVHGADLRFFFYVPFF